MYSVSGRCVSDIFVNFRSCMVIVVLEVALRLLLGVEKIRGKARERTRGRRERTGRHHKTGCIIAPGVERSSNYVMMS